MSVISHISVLAPSCPQSNPNHYAFTPDLCDVAVVAVSPLSALQDRKQRDDKHYKPDSESSIYISATYKDNKVVSKYKSWRFELTASLLSL